MKYLLITITLLLLAPSCASRTENGGLIGGAIGAGAGQAWGKDSKSTVIGAAAGSIIGAVLGNMSESEKQPQSDGEYVEISRQKTITVKERVPVQSESRKYYIDPKTGKKVYIK